LGAAVKTDDDIRRELDDLPPHIDDSPLHNRECQAKPTGRERSLKWQWADDVEIDLVAELLPTQGLTVAYGPSGCGKTFFAVDLACHVASGLSWYERAVTAGTVVYVAAEAPASVEKRVTAWKWRHEVTRLDVAVVQSSVDLLAGDAEAIVAVGKDMEADRGKVALVVIDTLARAMVGNENAPEDMGAFVAGCGIIQEALGCHVLVVHHCGKDEARGARGHSSLRAATDIEIEVAEGEEGTRTAKVTKHRDEATGGVFAFKLDVVELGTNRLGRTVTTEVVRVSRTVR
jgi:RecA-family ATPase